MPGFSSVMRSGARRLSSWLESFPSLKRQARKWFLSLPPALRGPQMIHDHLAMLHRQHGARSFLLIGANDGVTDDHLAPFIRSRGWSGVAVEPVPQYFREYQTHYQNYPVQCFNVAIHDSATSLAFYYLEDLPDHPLPAYAKGIGSFNRHQVEGVAAEIPGSDRHFRTMDVQCLTFEDLMRKAALPRVDVVVIDTEGYDANIVRQMDLGRWTPQAVIFEHKLLPKGDLEAALHHLENAGYQYRQDRTDVLAWRV